MPGYVEVHTEGVERSGKPLCQIVPDGFQLNLWHSKASFDKTKTIAPNGNINKDKPSYILIGEEDGFMYVLVGDGASQHPFKFKTNEVVCVPGYSPELEAEVDVWNTPTEGADYLIFNAFALASKTIDVTDWERQRTGFSSS